MTLIGILFSFLPPLLLNLQRKGKEVQCRNNLRQLMLSYRLYLASNSGESPASSVEWPVLPPRRWRGRLHRDPAWVTPPSLPDQARPWWNEIPQDLKTRWLQTRANSTHNLLGYYSRWTGFSPRGLGRLFTGGQIEQVEYLYCPSDWVLMPEDEVSGLANGNDKWLLKYPFLSSYIARPVGVTVPWEEEYALKAPFDSNPGSKVFLTEITSNHDNGVHVVRVNGSVDFVAGVPVLARSFSAFGIQACPLRKVLQPAYLFDIRLCPWIWLALDDPANAERLVRRPPRHRGHGSDHGGDGNGGGHSGDDHGDGHGSGGRDGCPGDGNDHGNEDDDRGHDDHPDAGHGGGHSGDDHGDGHGNGGRDGAPGHGNGHGDRDGDRDSHGDGDSHGDNDRGNDGPGNRGGNGDGDGCGHGDGSHGNGNGQDEDGAPHGNNGVGNGEDPQPPGNPPVNDGPGTGPGCPGNRGGDHGQDKKDDTKDNGCPGGKGHDSDGDDKGHNPYDRPPF